MKKIKLDVNSESKSFTEEPLISIVIPTFNEQESLPTTFNRLTTLSQNQAPNYQFEFIFVDDGSTDQSAKLLSEVATKNSQFRLVTLSRNFGHQAAIVAGFDCARGAAVVVLDADLQDPPELIPEMLRRWAEGYRIVYGLRRRRPGETWFKLATASAFYRLLSWIAEIEIPNNAGDFKLLDKEVIQAIRFSDEKNLYLRGLTHWVGYQSIGIEYDRCERVAGSTKFTIKKMMRLAFDGLTSFSERPLRIVSSAGALTTAFAMFLGAYYLAALLFFGRTGVVGWLTVVLLILFFSGLQMLSLGVVGLYVGKIFKEVKGRPTYVIEHSKSRNL
jgi:dolichol-phosphate mannosyltransferase